ncbi:pilus assembly protein TadG-related protein [Photobacterium indicum]|uniref:pilus assembly protein TadG-related protein n=1 Tax=Photobacterium indicum TaxID=81447 RepID=UPI003D132BC7
MVIRRINASPYRAQKGVVAIFATLAMVVLIGAGALALDVGNLILSKGKLQNLVDSAALSAAKAIDSGSDHAAAIVAGNEAINNNLILDGFGSMTIDGTDIHYEFSESLPFDSSTITATSPYVRVRIEDVDVADYLVAIFNIDMSARSSAVAGPSSSITTTCNVVPLSICEGSESSTTLSGYSEGSLHVLKASSSKDSAIGSGNFMPMALKDADGNTVPGASSYGDALAGSFDTCLTVIEDEIITSEPGNMVGPTRGIDTRFGIYEGTFKNDENKYPADKDTYYDSNNLVEVQTVEIDDGDGNTIEEYQTTLSHDAIYSFDDYSANQDFESCLSDSACQSQGYFRRVLSVPILKCDEIDKSGGRIDIPLKGLGCFFLVQPLSETAHVDEKGGGGNSSWIVGEFIKDCRVNTGNPGITPSQKGPYKIVLFNDPDSEDS